MNIKLTLILLGAFSATMMSADAPVITKTELIDLELVSRNTGEAGGVLPIINRTTTQVGREAFAKILSNPITDIKTLQTRQQLIKSLQNPELSNVIREQLLIIKNHEATLRRCFDKELRTKIATALEKSYYQLGALKGLNKSEVALDAMHFVEFVSLFEPVLHHLILLAATGHKGCGTPDFIVKIYQDFITNLGDIGPIVDTAITYGHGAMTVANVIEMASHLYYKAEVIDVIHEELISVNACLRACATIGDVLKKEPLAAAHIDAEILQILCENYSDIVLGSLDPHFADDEGNCLHLLSRVGPTLATYEKLGEQTELINMIMQSAGAVDAMLSASDLLTEQADQYSFANYQEGTAPYVKLDNFIHPQLTGTDCIQNSFVLSKDTNTDKLVITGPNAAGKSSITKAMVVNLVLAQTLSIVAAKNAVITPMHRIVTYINIRDNLADGYSAFASELIRTNNIQYELSMLNSKAPSLALFDDSLFRTTQPKEGELKAYEFIKNICGLDSTIALVVTHFEKLTELEAETNNLVRNYHIGLDKDAQGNTFSTYHLHPGISPRGEIFSIVARTIPTNQMCCDNQTRTAKAA